MLDPHLSAEISMVGMTFDSVGGLYLAYDLLGGENGPLSTIFRIVNYCVLMILVFWLPLGMRFALIAGIGLGIGLGLHVERAARGKPESLRFLLCIGAVRAISLALAMAVHKHYLFALLGIPIVLSLTVILPRFHLSPAALYQSSNRPKLQRKQFVLALVFGVLATLFSFLGAGIAGSAQHAPEFALRVGCTFAFATILISAVSPMIEWYADNLPAKSFGYVGAVFFMLGFAIQSIPSLLTIYDF